MNVRLRKRLPESQSILQVYAVIAVMLSGWTITAFLRKLPSWLLTLNLGEILTVFSYSMVTNLLESLIVLLLILVVCVLLPSRFLRDDFIVRGSLLAIGVIGALMAYLRIFMQFGMDGKIWLFVGPLLVLVLAGLLFAFSPRIPFLRAAVLWTSDRLMIFLFILLPLFVIPFVYAIVRNLF